LDWSAKGKCGGFEGKLTEFRFLFAVPSHAKDFSQENYRRLKLIAAEGQRKLAAQMKPPQFIPGVTKNSRYAHVQSKVTASLRVSRQLIAQRRALKAY